MLAMRPGKGTGRIRRGDILENNKKMKDFMSSAVIFILALYVLFEGYNIYTKSGKLLYLSPALIPLMLGTILLVLSIVLFAESLKEGGMQADPNTMRMLVGVVLMGLYTFVLLGMLPFWLATFLFMLLLMYFLEAGSIVKIVVISVLVTGLVIFLFQVCFRVPLP